MAVAYVGPALKAIGGAVGAFGKKKAVKVEELKGADKEAGQILGGLSDTRALGTEALGAYGTREDQRAADYSRFAKQAEGDFGSLLAEQRSPEKDPYNIYTNLRSGNLAALKDFGDYLGQVGQKQENQARALLGYSGDRGGSYSDALRSNRLGAVIGNQFGNIMHDLTPTMEAMVKSGQISLANAIDLVNRRTDTANYGQGVELNLPKAAYNMEALGINNLLNLINAGRANTAGWTEKANTVAKIGQAIGAVGDAFSMPGLGGGGAGAGAGGAGGLMSMLGQGATDPLQTQLQNYSAGGAYQPAYSGYNVGYQPSYNPAPYTPYAPITSTGGYSGGLSFSGLPQTGLPTYSGGLSYR